MATTAGMLRAGGPPVRDPWRSWPAFGWVSWPTVLSPRRWQLPRRTIRPVLLGSILMIAALGMAVAGTAEHRASRERLAAHVDRLVAQQVREFRALSTYGTDPVTGRPFSSSTRLFAAALQLSRPDGGEAMFGVVDGHIRVASAGTTSETLRRDPRLTRVVRQLAAPGRPASRDIETGVGTVRLGVTPTGRGDGGAWAIAYLRGPAEGPGITMFAAIAAATLVLMALAGWPLARRRPRRGGADQQDFLDDVTHELRTPITVMRGHLELLDGGDWTEVAETRALVLGELDRMSRLVDDLVTLTRARRPHFLRLAQVDVGYLMDEVLDKARTLGDRAWRIDSRASAFVAADPQRLTQALLALAHNAVKHTGVGDTVALGSRVDVRVGEVRLWVRDTGPGVRPEDVTRIFRRFERGTSDRREGSGLGLAIVTAIAETHGGRVALDSRLGLGATFSLILPYAGRPTPGYQSAQVPGAARPGQIATTGWRADDSQSVGPRAASPPGAQATGRRAAGPSPQPARPTQSASPQPAGPTQSANPQPAGPTQSASPRPAAARAATQQPAPGRHASDDGAPDSLHESVAGSRRGRVGPG